MTVSMRLGFVPLLDAAPLLVAEALGFAKQEGLALDLVPAPSWAALRDMLALGQVTAAQMLSPVPIAQVLGLGGSSARFEALSVLNANGNVFGISQKLANRLQVAGHDFDFVDARKAGLALIASAGDALRIGVPFPFSMHAELVHYWLTGLDCALPTALSVVSVPPSRMADALAADEIDAFCVGEPRGSQTVERGLATLLLPGCAIWRFAPEKVLATRLGWAEQYPDLAGPLIRAVWRAGRWLGHPPNRATASELLASPGRLAVSAEMIERCLTGHLVISAQGDERVTKGLIEFHAGAASFPWRSQAAWIGRQLANRYRLDPADAMLRAQSVFRSDLHRLHLAGTGADLPGASSKLEGSLAHATSVASDRGRLILAEDQFFDARIFDPSAPIR